MSCSLTGGQHAYFASTKTDRVYRLAADCHCCVAHRLFRVSVPRPTSLNAFDARVYHTGGRLFLVTPIEITDEAMGYNARNDEIRDNVTRMRREWEAKRGASAY